jgi:type III pantothenate kinase
MEQVPHVLACDVGNSGVRIAHVCGEDVAEVRRFAADDGEALAAGLAEMWDSVPAPKRLAASSVQAAGLAALEAAAEAIGQDVLLVGRDLPLPIDTALAQPGAIGVDRLCCAAAAFDRIGMACVVADFGTAITIDCVNDEGVFLGGAILPGVAMGASALAGGTCQLPAVIPIDPDWVFGADTQQAIAGGLVFGARGALRAIVEAYATELGSWPVVVVTGGDAELIAHGMQDEGIVQAIVPELVLRGVAMAYYRLLVENASLDG